MLSIALWTVVGPGWIGAGHAAEARPNILFIIMDDVGIDQMEVFGYGGRTPPSTPNLDADRRRRRALPQHLVDAGLHAPAGPCSSSGRFPLRTNVYGALGPNDLANSMVSPFEMTTPKLLATQGYESALFGKFHLGLQGHNPAGYAHAAQPRLELLRRLARRDRRSLLDRHHRRRRRAGRHVLLRLRARRGGRRRGRRRLLHAGRHVPGADQRRVSCRPGARAATSGGILDPGADLPVSAAGLL